MTLAPPVSAGRDLALPAIGFGTYGLNGLPALDVIHRAMEAGYRLFDSAFNYENEGAVGAAVRSASIPRDDVLVTSKLPGRHHRYVEALATVEESLLRTGLDHLDLYLIHWPNPNVGLYVEAWRALIEARDRGLVRHIGVSNFLPAHLTRLIEETGVAPEVNQVELHPYFQQGQQRAFDREHGIITQAWSPLGRATDLLGDPVLAGIADKHRITVPQVVLRWHTLIGSIPLPKSADPHRQAANLNVAGIELDETDLIAIAGLDRYDGRIWGQDPAVYEEF
ncbi:MAG TPA: aldo/keto reductase [Propioniciclava sp.]|uniref:aldo/keto reductase n=1 Tax=Propioniciclava sp. TaxID=2038686 RepID=UPI002C5354D7|nr:aldo/keto reductase [Propioniciclava sp.]HRL47835.1 aldo/keto reductase [Propioniciclava sp.]HRL81470.1 aldo/keto reductase [Propioniciclava sp.]